MMLVMCVFGRARALGGSKTGMQNDRVVAAWEIKQSDKLHEERQGN